MNQTSNIYAAGRRYVWEHYGKVCGGSTEGLAVAVACVPLSPESREALEKTFSTLGYGDKSVTYLEPGNNDVALEPVDIRTIIEGLDPNSVVICDAEATALCAEAYKTRLLPMEKARLSGRDVCVFKDLNALMENGVGKQKAWALLKELPRFS